ncbi:Alpha/Beta hydrolase protein [Dactylonectria macrodidyma]|uniref:Alpha/Beta hydrolase protein n=1 Tax=Dactylonectria macrodidyma TaxID=307937 RepID=A0A9P9DPF7_9HYPO|nr:Alpha/Beta hydrolase protein [Dactylonectria macrodidyma]
MIFFTLLSAVVAAATEDLQYHECFEHYRCARLVLPLDWLDRSDNRTIIVPIIKLPAVVCDDDPSFGGSVFCNPGGPGGSGVQQVLTQGRQLQAMLDRHLHYEIVSFDPRGIGLSSPLATCFRTAAARKAFNWHARMAGDLNQGAEAILRNYAVRRKYANLCLETDTQNDEIMRYAGTPSVARDMVAMVDRIDELRRKGSASERNPRDLPRLQYIGFSYGTILGNYFATLFPGRVGRMVLDGVVDADDYAQGPGWMTGLVDADKIFSGFFEGCWNHNPLCPVRQETDVTHNDMEARVDAFITSLDKSPKIIRYNNVLVPVTGNALRAFICMSLYNPHANFKVLAEVLSEAMAGNATLLAKSLFMAKKVTFLGDNGGAIPAKRRLQQGNDPAFAIICGDGDDLSSKGLRWWQEYISIQMARSHIMGPAWVNTRFGCSSWRIRPNWRITGPFVTPEADIAGLPDTSTALILFMSNRLDPVTPLIAAKRMAGQHPGSGLLVQNTMGHTVLGTRPSMCVARALRDYFEFGTLPSAPSRIASCEPRCQPWDDNFSKFPLDLFD